MKSNEQSGAVPPISAEVAWWAWPEDQKRHHAEALVSQALDAMEADGRNPGCLEALDLKSAMAAVEAHLYLAGITFAQRALARALGRGEERGSDRPLVTTTQALRRQWASLVAGHR